MVKFFGRGKERGGAPSAAENSASQAPSPNGWSAHHGKDLNIHGTDSTLHDPLESVVGVMISMCGRDPKKLDEMLGQQFGEKAEGEDLANREEVRRRVQEKWGAPGNSGGVSGLNR